MSLTPTLVFDNPEQPATWGTTFAWERELLGAVLQNPVIYRDLRCLVAPEDFSVSIHERLFEALPKVIGADGAIDRSAVPAQLGVYAWDADGGVPAWMDRLQAERIVDSDVPQRARAIHAGAERRRSRPYPIDIDTVAWCHQQAARLACLAERSDPLSQQVEWHDVIEEILHLGRSQTGGVVRKMELVFEHLIKLMADPNAPSRNRWRIEIEAFRMRIAHEAKPSMRQLIDLDAAWLKGIADAAADLSDYAVSLPRDLPGSCPFTFEDLTTEAMTVAALLEKLAATGDMSTPAKP